MRLFLWYIFFITSILVRGQGFISRFVAHGQSNHLSKAIFEINPGNYFAAGLTIDSADGYSRLCIMGLDNHGQLQWTKKYGSSKFQYGNNNEISRSFYKQGNFIYFVGGALDSNNNFIGILVKFNQNGDTLWQRIYKDTVDEIVPQMVTGSVDGGFLITGFFEGQIRTCLLIKTDAAGNELWRKKISKTTLPNVQVGNTIVQDSVSKKIVIVGYQYLGGSVNWSTFDNVLILDSLGVNLSQQKYGYGGSLFDLIQTKDKSFVGVGTSISAQTLGGSAEYTSYIVKFDINNPTTWIWKNLYFDEVTLNNGFTTIEELANGDLLIGGEIDTLQIHNQAPNVFIRFVKMTSNGNTIWKKYYNYNTFSPGNQNYQVLTDFHLTSDQGWVAAIEGVNAGTNPFLFIKYDSTGCDSSIAYCQMIASGIARNYLQSTSISLYPNPNSGELHVSVSDAGKNEQLTLNITDVSGRIVKTFKLNWSDSNQKINIKDLATGVYMVNIGSERTSIYKSKLIKED